MRIKHNCSVMHLQSEALLAYMIASFVYQEHGFDCELTSCTDYVASRHPKSLHGKGYAIDVGVNSIVGISIDDIAQQIRERLGDQYDVVVKSDHIHIEFDPPNISLA